jgi:hypothetical protein
MHKPRVEVWILYLRADKRLPMDCTLWQTQWVRKDTNYHFRQYIQERHYFHAHAARLIGRTTCGPVARSALGLTSLLVAERQVTISTTKCYTCLQSLVWEVGWVVEGTERYNVTANSLFCEDKTGDKFFLGDFRMISQDRQGTYTVKLRRVRATTDAV